MEPSSRKKDLVATNVRVKPNWMVRTCFEMDNCDLGMLSHGRSTSGIQHISNMSAAIRLAAL